MRIMPPANLPPRSSRAAAAHGRRGQRRRRRICACCFKVITRRANAGLAETNFFKNTHHVRNVRGSSLTLLPPSSRSLDTVPACFNPRACNCARVLARRGAPRAGA